MAKRSGANLAFLVAATAISVPRGWTFTHGVTSIDGTAAGDAVVDRIPLRGDYTVDFRALLEVTTPYVLPTASIGSVVAWSAEIVSGDTNGIVSSTRLFAQFRIEAAYDGAVEISGRIVGAGTALT